jgi:peptidoglycan/LPS O-acetylase OafA/YrhL
MYWIVLFTLLLPIILLVPFKWRIARLGVAIACFYFLLRGTGGFSLEIPPFILGVILAFEQEHIQRFAERWRSNEQPDILVRSLLGISCIFLLTADRWIAYNRTTLTLVVLGACLAVICAFALISWQKLFESPPMQWTGKRAFSLYLVHEPIVVALAFIVGTSMSPWLFVTLAATISLSACALFFHIVEMPSHRFARKVGKSLSGTKEELAATQAAPQRDS